MNLWRIAVLPVLALACLSAAPSVAAQPPLGDQPAIVEPLVSARIADRIRKTCPTIGARMFKVWTEANALKARALDLGYDADTVRAFLKDKAEKQKIYARAEDYLAANGATDGNVEGFCILGRKEIAANSFAGSLIYEK